jgi:adenylate cyclase
MMGIEIERKFLVKNDTWRQSAVGNYYCQGYLVLDPGVTVRVRIVANLAYLTLKGRVEGLSRPEFEYSIPVADAQEMLNQWGIGNLVEKNRYRIVVNDLVWEVDEFLGENLGLVIAEVELSSEAQPIDPPTWAGMEVSGDVRYYNSYLAQHPYATWDVANNP